MRRRCATAPFSLLADRSSLPDIDRVFLSAAGNWDRNRDGIVTCDEWNAYAGELFDAPTPITTASSIRTEYAKIVATDRMFQTVDLRYYDTDGDGKLDRAEFVEKPNRAFVLLDKDHSASSTRARLPARVLTPSRYSTQRRRLTAIRARIARPA